MTDSSDTPACKNIHIDMGAFFASVEQRDNPALLFVPPRFDIVAEQHPFMRRHIIQAIILSFGGR